MSNEANTIDELLDLEEQTTDHSVTTQGGDFEYEIPVAGLAVARFIEYVELGSQPQRPYQGKPKPDAEEVRLVFELTAPKHTHEIEVNGEKIVYHDKISITTALKTGEKAKFKKIFNKMTYGRPIKHMARMLGEAFLVTVFHNKSKDGTKTYANLNNADGEWFIGAPMSAGDPIAGTPGQQLNVPEALSPKRIFLWDRPTKATWDSLFIDGTRTVKDAAGVETEISKNWLQALILSAKNYGGSPLEAMLAGVDSLPTTEAEVKEQGKSATGSVAQTGTAQSAETKTASPSEQATAALAASKPAQTSVQDDLASIGL